MVFFEQAEGNGHEQTKYHLWDYAKKNQVPSAMWL